MQATDIIELQKIVYSKNLSRKNLLNYSSCTKEKAYRVQVFRNHSFELVEHTIAPFLDYAGIGVEFMYSGYDDSLSFTDIDMNTDAIIIWIDGTRYKDIDLSAFIKNRLDFLRKKYNKAVLLVPFSFSLCSYDTSVLVYDLVQLSEEMGHKFTDLKSEHLTGTKLSRQALIEISRQIGLKYLPAMLRTPIKAVVVDLDNTLYRGVLGEDGINGIFLTEGHKRLQFLLKKLSADGVFLCALSKNEQSDVVDMFDKRTDFPLKNTDFTKIIATWDSKYQGMQEILQFLNIGSDSVVFVDDNIGEIMSIKAQIPQINVLLASQDASSTADMLTLYPRMLRISHSNEDNIRKTDVQANELRSKMKAALSEEEYIKSLHLKLNFNCNDPGQIIRISELSNKTNQFIFNYMRYTNSDLYHIFNDCSYFTVTASLSDCLSDSGLIGVCIGKLKENYVEIEDCFISCRALGRGIDDIIVLGAMNTILRHFSCSKLKVDFQKGPKNVPAERFVQKYLNQQCLAPSEFDYSIPEDLISINYLYYGEL